MAGRGGTGEGPAAPRSLKRGPRPPGAVRPAFLLALLAAPALAGCALPLPASGPCARLDAPGWVAEHAVGEPLEVRVRFVNCGDEARSLAACADGSLFVRVQVPDAEDPLLVHWRPCLDMPARGEASPLRQLVLLPDGGAALGGASWDGRLQECNGFSCGEARDPAPGDYALVLTTLDGEATLELPLRLRAS